MSKSVIEAGKGILGIELGSTRIKMALIDEDYRVIASGSHAWENHYESGIWTYPLQEVRSGLQDCFASLQADIQKNYGLRLSRLQAIGVSAMMHGYLPFDKDGEQLSPFVTWRNTNTEQAAEILSNKFEVNIPLRWSIAHLYQQILNQAEHISRLCFFTTLSGYVHWLLTGEKVLGIDDASGMFPIDATTGTWLASAVKTFNSLTEEYGYQWKLEEILPRVLKAGEYAGSLTMQGARLLDPKGDLQPGVPLCPPEGDAGTGMVATNSVAEGTGNISAGTSVFAMLVQEKPLSRAYREVDPVMTPDGKPVAMVHCNNCTSDIDAWASMMAQFASESGHPMTHGEAIAAVFKAARKGTPDCGGIINYNHFAGEPIAGTVSGVPMVLRRPDADFTFANFSRSLVFGAIAGIRFGTELLETQEHLKIKKLYAHGGFFKTPIVGQEILAAALNVPVTVNESAELGGPYGMALLAAYMIKKESAGKLERFLAKEVFSAATTVTLPPDPVLRDGFNDFFSQYKKGMPAETAGAAILKC